jgi:hypothetical protein
MQGTLIFVTIFVFLEIIDDIKIITKYEAITKNNPYAKIDIHGKKHYFYMTLMEITKSFAKNFLIALITTFAIGLFIIIFIEPIAGKELIH